MREINIRFTMDNAAFDDDDDANAEAMRVLGRIAGQINIGRTGGRVLDVNGNSVGEWAITETDGDK